MVPLELEFPLLVVMGSKVTPVMAFKDLKSLMKPKRVKGSIALKHANTPVIKLNLITDLNGRTYSFKEIKRIRKWSNIRGLMDFSISLNECNLHSDLTVSDYRAMVKAIKDNNKVQYGSSFNSNMKMSRYLNSIDDDVLMSKVVCVAFFEKYYPRYLGSHEKVLI